MTQFFSISALREKNESFDLKSWASDWIKNWPKFLGQMTNFSFHAPREKI